MKRENCEMHDEREIKTEFLVEIQATERGVSAWGVCVFRRGRERYEWVRWDMYARRRKKTHKNVHKRTSERQNKES